MYGRDREVTMEEWEKEWATAVQDKDLETVCGKQSVVSPELNKAVTRLTVPN